ncbi:uncharacterized protein LOC133804650 isoform X2 [Humulus lupulus]|uniref:uncharacterized protein LOC133804650 isoform X2 n=1 Tax=Humulus lupulus TaxID=3486 RepID=UPI002B403CAE|nr:uncharacterized protein LOC133804650 isoform X2 [Humulus lupulus]
MAIAFAVAVGRPTSAMYMTRCRAKWVFTPSALSCPSSSSPSSSSSSSSSPRKLVLYSKPGCCLCDGLKEKLQAAFLLSGPDSLHDVDLQIRDITSNPEWEKAYQYEIPVLAKLLSDGTEINLTSEELFRCSSTGGQVYLLLLEKSWKYRGRHARQKLFKLSSELSRP